LMQYQMEKKFLLQA